MYLKRLQLRGFKTFVQPTDLEFDAGITAIVGPNGSGKSNLVDALRWVLGEQSLRLLRSRRTEDVIFAGSSQRARVSLAEVSLTLDNEDDWLGLPYAEVTIARRAHRSGENEYLLNAARVRLRDINDLLNRAHAGQTGYTILGQGMVDAVLSSRPEERRVLIDETAQLRVPQAQLEEAQQRLSQAQEDLAQLEKKLAELQPRLASAARLAAQAQERARLADELLALQRRHFGNLWVAANKALDEAQARRRQVAQQIAEIETAMAGLQVQAGQARTLQTEMQSRLASLRTRRAELERSSERWRRQLAVARERQGMLVKHRQHLAEEKQSLSERITIAQAELVEVEARLQEITAERAAVDVELGQAEAGTLALVESEQQKLDEVNALRSRLDQLSRRLSEQKEQLVRLEHRRDTLNDSIARCSRSIKEIEARLPDQAGRVARLTARRVELRQSVQTSQQQVAQQEQALTVSQNEMEVLRKEREALGLELARRQAQWEQITERSEPLLQALRSELMEKQTGIGFLGTVEQIIAAGRLEIEAGLARAIAAALQGFRFNVVVETWDAALRTLSIISGRPVGETWILPESHTTSELPPTMTGDGYLGPASAFVHFTGPHAGIVGALLSRSLVVSDLDAALRLLPQCPPQFQLVTVAGEIVQSWGRASALHTGGPPLPDDEGRSSLRALSSRIAELDARINATRQATAEAQRQLRKAQGMLHEAHTSLRLIEAEMANAASAQRRSESELQRLRQTYSHEEEDMRAIADQGRALANSVTVLASETSSGEKRVKELEEEMQAIRLQRGDPLAALRHRRELLQREEGSQRALLENHRRRAADVGHELIQVQNRSQTVEHEEGSAAGEIDAAKAHIQTISVDLKQLASEISEAEARLRSETERAEALRAAERGHYRSLAQAEADGREATTAEERARKETAALERQIRSELGSLDTLEPGDTDDTLEPRLRQTQDELRRIGEVDPAIIDEHAALQAERDHLEDHLRDLRESVQGLATLVSHLEGALNERFKATFDTVQIEFQRYFRALFGGGHGQLELIVSEEGNTSGLEIVAQPPGKRMQSLASLSGGERAMTSIAFFFALLHVQPPPFCVLDEVDAALDDANAGRFSHLLRQLAGRTQFLIITHNRVTMEAAGTLYGVTMAETGTSQVVSLRLQEAQAQNNAYNEVSLNV